MATLTVPSHRPFLSAPDGSPGPFLPSQVPTVVEGNACATVGGKITAPLPPRGMVSPALVSMDTSVGYPAAVLIGGTMTNIVT